MAYREVTMLEVKEVLRLWLGGTAHKRIAAQLGLNVKTVRRYVAAARASGVALLLEHTEADSYRSLISLRPGRVKGVSLSINTC